MVRPIQNRTDVSFLVRTFYAKIRQHEELGPIFNSAIAEDEWEAHLEKLTDFWETNLFAIPKFKGNPMQAHRNVDRANNHQIQMEHFGHWLQLWFETIDTHFEGLLAERAKHAARKMATGLFMGMKAGITH